MAESLRILILEDSPADADLIQFELQEAGLTYQAKVVMTESEFLRELNEFQPDLILSDHDLPNYSGTLALAEVRRNCPDIPFILVTGAIGEDRAIEILAQGAKDYVLKTRLEQRLVFAVRRAIAEAEERKTRRKVETELREAHRTLEERVKNRTAELQAEIAARKKVEEALRASNELFSLFMRHSPIYTFIKEVSPTTSLVLQASDNYQQMIGTPGCEMVGKNMAELFPSEFAAKITADDWAVVSKGNVLKLDEELNGRSYTTIKFPIVRGDKNLLAGYTIDITERKRAEEALRESEERFRKIFEEAHLGIVITSPSFAFEKANPAFCRMMGYTADELRSITFSDITHPDHLNQDIENVKKVGRGEMPFYRTEKRYINKSGKVLWGNLIVSSIRDDHGALRYYLSTVIDITERKKAEEEKTKLQEQLLQSQKMESVGRLAGGVAHDFNNMLGVILGHAEMAIEQVDPTQPLGSDLRAIRKAAERSSELTRQLMAFARKQTVSPKVLDMNETVTGMLKMLQRLIGEDIHLDWLPGFNLQPVKIDPSQIDQILANLCVNARDAIAGVGKVTIETGNITFDEAYCTDHTGFIPGEYVLLAVSDNGCGMNKETLNKLFEPFFTTKETGQGTGLGLATVYGIVQQNKGFINVYSEPDQGSTFKIYLPRCAGKAEGVRTEGTEPAMRGQETILLAEDEPDMLDLTAMSLKMQGYTVLAARTPGEAIRLAREHVGEIHLLITDVVMPEMNGKDLAKNLLSLYPNIKRLFMSGYTANVIAHHGVLDEGVHFIPKPFSRKGLATKVREALNHK